jgi:hypothetical protein
MTQPPGLFLVGGSGGDTLGATAAPATEVSHAVAGGDLDQEAVLDFLFSGPP